MKKIVITYPNRSQGTYTFEELGLEENATDEEIAEAVDEEVLQQISWGHEVIEE